MLSASERTKLRTPMYNISRALTHLASVPGKKKRRRHKLNPITGHEWLSHKHTETTRFAEYIFRRCALVVAHHLPSENEAIINFICCK